MNIQKAAEASGLTADTIRFYEKEGVVPPAPRRENGYREYTDEHVAVLRLARGLRDLGAPLTDVATILPVAHDGTCGDLREALVETLTGVLSGITTRIEDLRRTSREVTVILDGLREMQPADSRVPGLDGCRCMELTALDAHGQAGR